MHITGMTIRGIPPFTEPVEFEFNERVNLLIGPNATGKSTILRILQSRTEIDGRFAFQLSEDWLQHPQMNFLSRRQDVLRRRQQNVSDVKLGTDLVPWIYMPAVRLNLPLSSDGNTMATLYASALPSIGYDGGEEIEPANPSRRLQASPYYFDGSEIAKYNGEIAALFRQRRMSSDALNRSEEAKDAAYQCVQRICSDILVNGQEPTDYIYGQPIRGSDRTVTTVFDNMKVTTIDSTREGLFAGNLSSGTQGTLLWVWHLALNMATFSGQFGSSKDWQSKPAILLIDEIENHLHPTWQRRVIPALLEHFPGLQIFATTHSPFVVAGLKAGQVHLLNRDADGVVTATTNTEDIIGWTADEILRTMMGVQDPTDDATAAAARELRGLRDVGPQADATEEERRQALMQELRRLVDRDLLAGGPRAAQRELFEQQFTEALEKYRQSQDSGQENS